MRKEYLSLTVPPTTFKKINKIAEKYGLTRSGVARMLIELIDHIPEDRFKKRSPLPEMLGLTNQAKEKKQCKSK